MPNKFKIHVVATRHWWKKDEQYVVYADEKDWPEDKVNERGLTFEGQGTHFRLIDEERYILKSDVAVIDFIYGNKKTAENLQIELAPPEVLKEKIPETYIINDYKFQREALDSKKSLLKSFFENDPVNRPAHYTDGRIEVIDFIEDKKLDFHLGNAVKYISRAGKKDPAKFVEDLQKAIWYINRAIERHDKNIVH